jgi:hypothetical protein
VFIRAPHPRQGGITVASITFTDEAAESFANFLQHIQGYTVEVTDDEGKQYDARVLGSASDEVDDYFAVRLQLITDQGEPTGVPFAQVVRDLSVY